jgi:dinuclear metal center YbgI/SA1388 family protein
MALPLARVLTLLEGIAPLALAEPWDNVGLLLEPTSDRRALGKEPAIARVLLTIDLTPSVLAEAVAGETDLVVAYHPPWFRPLKRLSTRRPDEAVLIDAARAGIAIYSPHTALDAAARGVNDWLADSLGASTRRPLVPTLRGQGELKLVVFVPETHTDSLRTALSQAGAGVIGAYSECSYELTGEGTFIGDESTNPVVGERGRLERVAETRLEMVCKKSRLAEVTRALERTHPYEEPAWDVYPLEAKPESAVGMGRSVTLDEPASLATLISRVKQHLGLETLRIAQAPLLNEPALPIRRVAVCAGSGGSLFEQAEAHDLYVTGELRHHDILHLIARGASVILCEHSSSERGFLPALATRLSELSGGDLEVLVSRADLEPIRTT